MDRAGKVGIFTGAIAAFLWYSGISTYPGCETVPEASGKVRLTRFLRIDYAAGQCYWYENAHEVFWLVLVLFSVAVLVTVIAFSYSIYRSSREEERRQRHLSQLNDELRELADAGYLLVSARNSRNLDVEKMKLRKVLVSVARIIFAIVASVALISIVAVIFSLPERPIIWGITVTMVAIVILLALHRL